MAPSATRRRTDVSEQSSSAATTDVLTCAMSVMSSRPAMRAERFDFAEVCIEVIRWWIWRYVIAVDGS